MDIKTPESRSKNMSAIKSKDTKPELKLRKALFRAGFRYRININLTGKPDIVFFGKKLVIFVDGCFWHGCPACYKKPDTNKEFWEKKLKQNKKRDEEVKSLLIDDGWQVLRFWEHQINSELEEVLEKIKDSFSHGKG